MCLVVHHVQNRMLSSPVSDADMQRGGDMGNLGMQSANEPCLGVVNTALTRLQGTAVDRPKQSKHPPEAQQ